MHWVIVALIAPFLWSILNHTDKYLISKYSHDTGIGGLAVFSSLFAIFILPIAYFLNHGVFLISGEEAGFLIITGVFTSLGILFYLYALDRDDASHVVPFWFLIPILGYVLGVLLLGEQLAGNKILGSILTLIGAIILSLEFDEGFAVKTITALLMVGSSVFLALSDVIFKKFALAVSFWPSIFWNQIGMVFFGLACLFFVRRYRQDFIKICKIKTKNIVALNIFGEIVQTIAGIINYYATLLAPIALVLLVGYTFQPLFVFIEGILITKFFPHIIHEHISRKHIFQKLASITIMGIGVYLVLAL